MIKIVHNRTHWKGKISVRRVLTVGAIAGAVIAAVFVVVPRNKDLFILHRPEVEHHRQFTTSVIRDALSIARTRVNLAKALGSRFESGSHFANMPNEKRSSISLSDIVSGSLDVSFGAITISVNLINLIQAYIDRYSGGKAMYVMVETFSESKLQHEEPLYAINVSVLTRGARLIGNPPLDRSELVDRLSQFFIEELVVEPTNCDESLCASMMPYSEKHLESLAGSFDALGSLAKVGPCEDSDTKQQCLDSIRQTLEIITAAKEGKTVAQFGLFFVELRQLKLLITTAGTTDKLASALESISKHYSFLSSSTEEGRFFANLLDSTDALEQFLKTNSFEDLDLTRNFLSTFTHFLDGRDAYRVGDTSAALEHYKAVEEAPPWFEHFLDAYLHISTVRSQPNALGGVNDALAFFSRDDLRLVNFFRAALLAQTICVKVAQDESMAAEERDELFGRSEDALRIAVQNTSGPHDEYGARIERIRSLHAFGRVNEANTLMAEIEEELSKHVTDRHFRLTLMSAATFFTEAGQFHKAKTWLEHAAKVEYRSICVYERAPEFRAMRESDPHELAQWASRIRQQVQPEC